MKFVSSLAAGLLIASSASAAVTLSFATDQAVYNTTPGGDVIVIVKMVETRDSVADVSIIESENGLLAFDFEAALQSGSANITDASTSVPYDPAFTPDKPFSTPTLGVSAVDFTDFFSTSGPMGTQNGLVREIVLGTLKINASTNSSFKISDYVAGTGSITFGIENPETLELMATQLDGLLLDTEFTINVPEPTSLGLLAVGGMLLAKRRR